MTSLTDRTFDALGAEHDKLVATTSTLTAEQLLAPSAAAEWTLAQVLSHLGSAAEIGMANLKATLEGEQLTADFNQCVWSRWDGMTAHAQAQEFVSSQGALVAAFADLSTDQRASLQIKLGFMPMPLPIGSYAGLLLSETAYHSWDLRAGLDPQAVVAEDTALLLLEHLSGSLAMFLGLISKPDVLTEPVVLRIDATQLSFAFTDTVQLVPAEQAGATATLAGPVEAAVRLIGGRLTADHTAAGTQVVGNVNIEDLRRVFPGY